MNVKTHGWKVWGRIGHFHHHKESPHKILINCKVKNSNVAVEKCSRYHLTWAMKSYIIYNGTNRHHAPLDMVCWARVMGWVLKKIIFFAFVFFEFLRIKKFRLYIFYVWINKEMYGITRSLSGWPLIFFFWDFLIWFY